MNAPPDDGSRDVCVGDDDGSEAWRLAKRTELTDALEEAAVRLRDAELEHKAAGQAYRDALQAFNRFVAPVVE